MYHEPRLLQPMIAGVFATLAFGAGICWLIVQFKNAPVGMQIPGVGFVSLEDEKGEKAEG